MAEQLSLHGAWTERDRIIDALRQNHSAYLTTLRSFARVIALQRGIVTIDDVREEIARQDFFMPADIGADERVLGAVFTRREFEAIGQQPTRRSEWAARVGRARSNITVYRLRKDAS